MKVVKLTAMVLVGLMFVSCRSTSKDRSAEEESTSELDAWGASANAGVNLGIDPVAIDKHLKEMAKQKHDKVGFMQGLAETAYREMNVNAAKKKKPKINVAVCDMGQRCHLQLDPTKYFYKTYTNGGSTFGVWGFGAGTFVNPGSGGWDNWVLIGCHDHKPGQGARPVNFTVCK